MIERFDFRFSLLMLVLFALTSVKFSRVLNIPCDFGEVKKTTKMPMIIAMHVSIKNARTAMCEFGNDQNQRLLNIQ
jgi:hypothetical protein